MINEWVIKTQKNASINDSLE